MVESDVVPEWAPALGGRDPLGGRPITRRLPAARSVIRFAHDQPARFAMGAPDPKPYW